MLHAVIMAGGSGTRFWPASRSDRPKQLLDLVDRRTMLSSTVDRLGELVPRDRVWIVTARKLATAVAQQLPQLPPTAIVAEPCRRDTAGCIGLAATLIAHQDPDATMLVLPSDHVIRPEAQFRSALVAAAALLENRPGTIVAFGIKPTYPAESFGYIERGRAVAAKDQSVFEVARFREKPKAALASQYVAAGNFYWNSGIFIWKARTILEALATHRPALVKHLNAIGAAIGSSDYERVLEREFAAMEAVSIDYAVMEHHRDVLVVEAPFTWDDLGSWQALARLRGSDAQGNTIVGRHVGINTTGSIVRSDDHHLVATLGVKDCIVIHTPDATLVANKNDEEAIRSLVKLIEENGWQQYL